MAKASRAKRPATTGLPELTTDPTTIAGHVPTENIAEMPFKIELKEPVQGGIGDNGVDSRSPVVIADELRANGQIPPLPGENVPIKIINLDVTSIKFDVSQQQIDEYKALVPTLVIKDINDREGLAKVYETRQKLKKARTGAKSKAAELTEDAKKYTKAVNDQFKKYEEQLLPLEANLQEKEDWFAAEKQRKEDEEARIAKEKQDAEDKLVRDRTAILITNGCTFDADNGNFLFKDVIVTADQLKSLPVERFDTIASQIRMVHEEDIENANQAAAEVERLRLLNEQKQNELNQQQLDLQKQIVDFRVFQLTQIGMIDAFEGYRFKNDQGVVFISFNDIKDIGASEWQKKFVDVMLNVNKLKANQEEADKLYQQALKDTAKADADVYLKEQSFELRKQQLEALGFEFTSEEPGVIAKLKDNRSICIIENQINADEKEWPTLFQGINAIVIGFRNVVQESALKAEKRRGDLKALGLTIEPNTYHTNQSGFVYRGTHVFHAFIPDDNETLLKRNDDWWNNKTLPGVKAKVATLKEADETEITRLLNEETEKRDAAKDDKAKLADTRRNLHLAWTLLPKDLVTPNSIALIERISSSLNKMTSMLDEQIELLTI